MSWRVRSWEEVEIPGIQHSRPDFLPALRPPLTIRSALPGTWLEQSGSASAMETFPADGPDGYKGGLIPAALSPAYDLSLGDAGFEILDTNGVIGQDLALEKNFRVREPLNLQFRAEFFTSSTIRISAYRMPT